MARQLFKTMKSCPVVWVRSALYTLVMLALCVYLNAHHPPMSAADNCGLIVNAGPDKYVCDDNPVTTLEGHVSGSGLRDYVWMPSDGLSNPNSLRPTVTVTEAKCYVLTGKKKGTTNLIVNGNFEQGATGFSTDYTPGTMSCFGLGFLDCAGTYAVLNNPQTGHTSFSPCGDHTSGNGNMMVCNGAPGFVNVWCQTVAVTPGRDYCISAWACSVNPASPAQLEFSINGSPLGLLSLSSTTCLWEELDAEWNSGGNAIARICVINNNIARGGNDFAIDDIEMYEICEQYDTVCVDIEEVDAIVQPPKKICCDNPVVQLDGTGSSVGPGYSYKWIPSNGGHILSGENTLMPLVDQPGTYTLIVTGPEGCTEEYKVEVEGSLIPPRVYAEVRDTLDCDHPEVRIFGGAFPDNNVTYDWQGPGGFRSTEQAPYVDQPGVYTLIVTDDCGCFGTAMVTVYENDNILKVNIKGDSLNCADSLALLVAESNRSNINFNWSGPNGFQSFNDSVIVRDTGWYFINVNDAEGCENQDSFEVIGDFENPQIITQDDTMTCYNPEVRLDPESDGQFFLWKLDGRFISEDSSITTNIPGIYTIIAEGKNGCIDSALVEVKADTAVADFVIQGSDILCDSSSTDICFDTLTNIEASYTWQFPDTSFSDISCIEVENEGWIYLSSLGSNGCVYEDSAFIDKFEDQPTHILGDSLINCSRPRITLRPGVPNSAVFWRLPDGSVSDSDSLTIGSGGTYIFTIDSRDHECPITDSINIWADFQPPQADLDSDSLSCTMDSVQIVHQTQDSIINWSWSGPGGYSSRNASPWVTNPGRYEVVLRSVNGCEETILIDVPQSANYPDILVFGDTINCRQPQVEIYAVADRPGLSYAWDDPGGGTISDSSFFSRSSGTYTLTVTSPDSCVIERTIHIPIDTAHPVFEISGIDTITCINRTIDLSVDPQRYSSVRWTGPNGFGSDQRSITIGEAGTYNVAVMGQNGCRTERNTQIQVDTIPPDISINGDTINCLHLSIPLIARGNFKGSPQWYGPQGPVQGDDTIRVNYGGRFNALVRGENGCENSDSFKVEVDTLPPEASVYTDTITCAKEKVWIGVETNADSTIWNSQQGTFNADSVQVSLPGMYDVRLVGKNGCLTTRTVEVEIDTLSPIVSTRNDSLTCHDNEATLHSNVRQADRYWWISEQGDTLSTGFDPSVNTSGTYICVAIDESNGCTTSSPAVIYDLRDLPMAQFITDQPDCDSDLGQISVSSISGGIPPYLISINHGTPEADRNFSELNPGQHIISIIDALGCVQEDTIQIHEIILAESNLTSEITIDLGDSVELMLNVSPDPSIIRRVEWSPDVAISCTDCLNPRVSPGSNQRYLVEVIDTNGCSQILEILVRVNLPRIYIPNAFTPGDGNGLNDVFFPHTNLPEEVFVESMQIYTRWGELVFNNEGFKPNEPEAGWDGTFNGERLNPGVYVYLIQTRLTNGEKLTFSGDVTIID